MTNGSPFPLLSALDALTGALFLLTALGVVAMRQVLASLQLFILQSLLLAISAVLLGAATGSYHLFAVAAITIATKTVLIPWLLRHTLGAEIYQTREIERVLNIPSSLFIAAGLVLLAYAITDPILSAVEVPLDASICRSGWQRYSSAPSRSWCGAKRCRNSLACSRSRTGCFSRRSPSSRT